MPPSLFTELGLHTTRAESFVARGVRAWAGRAGWRYPEASWSADCIRLDR